MDKNYRTITIITIIFLLLSALAPITLAKNSDLAWWNEEWNYREEINIPIDTNLEISKYQPIDLLFEFQNPCWAKNENENSIRIVIQESGKTKELESQIYELEFTDDTHISSCGIVFLIPEDANGNEAYFVYYDASEKTATNYFDHVAIEESYYYYEPIPGYSLESDYYKIIDDDFLSYGVSYEGQFMGYNICQHAMRLKEESTEALPKNIELFAAFDFKYTYERTLFGYSSTSQKLESKEVLVDGNLMLEFRIVSTSKFNDLRTTATYKYYHCPGTDARIHTHVKHEALKEIEVTPLAPATNTDGVFASLQAGGVKSRSIKDLNVGEILPFLHFSNEQGTISEYDVDIDPEYIPNNPDIRIIGYQDDVELGKNPWISFDEGKQGNVHSVIFSSNEVLVSGTDEKDGLQINAFEVDYPHLPGLENNVATMQIGRNSFEAGGSHDLSIPSDFVVEFNADFFSSRQKGYPIIEEEAKIFKELVKLKPKRNGEIKLDSEDVEKNNLSVVVHFAPSAPMGSTLSALLGLNLSYITVELYRNDTFIYLESAVKLPLNPIEELRDTTVFEKIIATLKTPDYRNISFFKKAEFNQIAQGKYVIKIFRENPFRSSEKKFIGYAIVDLKEDEKIHIFCSLEASMTLTFSDQNENFVKNADVILQKDGTTISKEITDENGQATVKAPTNIKPYDLVVKYNGNTIYEDTAKLGLLHTIIPLKKQVNVERYSLNLKVLDTWGQAPEIQLNPTVVTGADAYKISGQKTKPDAFVFTNLTPESYKLSLVFKSFTLEKNLEISKNEELELMFPAEYKADLEIYDARGNPYEKSKIIISRNGDEKEFQVTGSSTAIDVPPGKYKIEVLKEDKVISTRNIEIYGSQNYDLISKEQPLYLTLILILFVLGIAISAIFFGYKKKYNSIFVAFAIILILFSLFLPWWQINGSTDAIETSTNLYLIPNNMITITTTQDSIAGEPSYLPPEFIDAIKVLISIAVAGCVLISASMYLDRKDRKGLSKISKILGILSTIGPVLIFIVAINELSKVSIGGIFGSGKLDIGVPGETQIYSVLCNWGPAIGFYLYIIALLVLFTVFFYYFRKNRKEHPKENKGFDFQHPLFGMSFMKWFYILQKNGGVDNRYLLRGMFIGVFSLFFIPARFLFKLKFGEKINKFEITNPPVFILGHWRSGTTYLHELLAKDPQFCYVTLWHTMLPDSYPLLEPMKEFMAKFLPSERPMDKIKVEIDGPYEEEAGIAVISPWSFFHGLHFPKNAEEQYLNSIHYKGLSKDEKEEWDKSYYQFMKTVSYTNNGKRLLLKDPANTARIPTLLKLFPDAKFIHIKRNPYKVYLSTVKMRNNVLKKLALQKGDKEVIEKQVVENYKRLMKGFFEQEKLIPSKNYVEISYEELVKDPIKQVRKIYSKLKLPGFKKALPGMNEYLESKKDYKVNVYKIDEKIIKHVEKEWAFTIKRWGYKPPGT